MHATLHNTFARALMAAAVAIAFVLGGVAARMATIGSQAPHAEFGKEYYAPYQQQIDRCIDSSEKLVARAQPDVDYIGQLTALCGSTVFNIDSLVDFDIRREKFLRQELDERVILWMVVAITLSGVLLAGLQLLASYKLASSGHGAFASESELTAQKDKLSLKSSVTGLIILVVSLVFFFVYVKWVYSIQECQQQKPIYLQGTITKPNPDHPPPK